MTDENMNVKSTSHGGARPNAGRPKGKMNPATLEKKRVMEKYDQKVMLAADKLFESQMSLASGQSFLYKIEKSVYKDEKGHKKVKAKKPKIVTETWEIESYLTGEIDGSNELTDPEDTYYFITAKSPDSRTIDSMLDRVHGKAQQKVDHTSKGESISFVFDNSFDDKEE